MPVGAAALPVERFFQISLLGLVSSGYLAVAGSGYLDTPTVTLTAAGLLLRALLVLGVLRFEISARAVTLLTLGYIGFFPLDYFFLSGDLLRATVHLVFFLAVVKILTARSARDYLATAAISFLELLAAALLSANLNFFLCLAAYLVFAVSAFTSAEIRRSLERGGRVARSGSGRFHARLATLSMATAAGILILTGGLFFLLPRTLDAAFRHLVSQRYYLPGFSNQVTLGQIGEVKTRSSPVMHVRLDTRKPLAGLKWRGNALASFDGRRWFNPPEAGELLAARGDWLFLAGEQQRRRVGQRIRYRVDLDAIDTDTLFFAGSPEVLNLVPRVIRNASGGYRLGFLPAGPYRYEAASLLDSAPEPGAPLSLTERAAYLGLPAQDPRIGALARKLTLGFSIDRDRASVIEQHLRTGYGYTLELLEREAPDPIAHFLFERRKGHCEYFASAMAVMLRSLGIPARLVNGFQGGTWNPISELYLIRASDAHSWVEAWLPESGWTSFDPTPPDPNPPSATLWSRLSLYLDAADTFWREWILSYDLGRQVTLASGLERAGRRWSLRWFDWTLATAAEWKSGAGAWLRLHGRTAGAAVALVIAGGFLLRFVLGRLRGARWRSLRARGGLFRLRRGQPAPADATLLYGFMLELLRRRGYQKPAWFTPGEFASSLPDRELAALVARFTRSYNEMRFGRQVERAPTLASLLDQLRAFPG